MCLYEEILWLELLEVSWKTSNAFKRVSCIKRMAVEGHVKKQIAINQMAIVIDLFLLWLAYYNTVFRTQISYIAFPPQKSESTIIKETINVTELSKIFMLRFRFFQENHSTKQMDKVSFYQNWVIFKNVD